MALKESLNRDNYKFTPLNGNTLYTEPNIFICCILLVVLENQFCCKLLTLDITHAEFEQPPVLLVSYQFKSKSNG